MLLPEEDVIAPGLQSMPGRLGIGKIANLQSKKTSTGVRWGSCRARVCCLPDPEARPKGQKKITSGRGGFGETLVAAKLLRQKCMLRM